jgi:hypothetical protein
MVNPRRTRRAFPRAHHRPITTSREKSPSRAPASTSRCSSSEAIWRKAIGFTIGAKAFLSSDKHGDIQLTRMGLKRPRRLRVVKAKS